MHLYAFIVIAKIHRYRGFYEGHHFIQMAMEVYGTLVIWIVLLRNMFVFSTKDDWEVIYFCFFAFNFLGNMLVLFLSILKASILRGRLHWRENLNLLLLLNLMICM